LSDAIGELLGHLRIAVPIVVRAHWGAVFGDEPMLIVTQYRSHHLWPDVRVRAAAARRALPPAAR
jgi:hypothetical protein